MSYEFVFVRSIVLTIIIGLFLLVTGRAARKRGCIVAFCVLAAAVHLIWWCLPELKGGWSEAGRWLVSAWVGAVLTALFLTLPVGLFLVARGLLGRRSTVGMRVPLTFVAVSLIVGIGVSFGTVGGPVVREEVVHVNGLPEGLDGLRVANIGDVHIGPFIVPEDFAQAIDIVNSRKVDLLAITGDLIDDLSQLEPTLDALERSDALPVLSILGNHDKYPNEAAVVAALRARDPRIQVLINNSVVVHPRGVPLRIAGVDYPLASDGRHMLPRDEQDAAMRRFADLAFAEASPGDTLIALSHHPEFFPIAASRGAVLTLSSHTHGGQVRLFGRPVIVAYDYMHGIYRDGAASLDVTSGLGHWLPLRIGVPREISIITLRRA
ncbi:MULTISPECIES: metallophosphoesterase [Pseudomonas]|jgi:predicted MPP superfamily phosphohydrolase|uniref:Metallophosphoesterase n=1 Tax=Pseudomonas serbiensis TaxID=3064350 RepID=A0ABT9CXT9_9PSED|nr:MULTISPECIES: metallophosphoesterase [Pseudomonas]MCS3514390.1 putative MPP superfamily phosphohydrolase/heme/copper-type cytochrome/quinol oxidase subunit 4 [Pseudomonas grimontii]MDO7930314.1 metallophosphoesterase [Pseudomonas sp. KFB-138]MDT9673597.1 metallophosphoesterase [Pseudomonas sp. JV414]